jgi:hypothetical protein
VLVGHVLTQVEPYRYVVALHDRQFEDDNEQVEQGELHTVHVDVEVGNELEGHCDTQVPLLK